jgi:hypothetical protein
VTALPDEGQDAQNVLHGRKAQRLPPDRAPRNQGHGAHDPSIRATFVGQRIDLNFSLAIVHVGQVGYLLNTYSMRNG